MVHPTVVGHYFNISDITVPTVYCLDEIVPFVLHCHHRGFPENSQDECVETNFYSAYYSTTS